MSMPEGQPEGAQAETKPEKARWWGAYVDALARRMELTTPPEVLDGRMEFDLPTWLSQVQLSDGNPPVHLDIRTRKGEVRLRSDRVLPEVLDVHTPIARHLEVFALTEAKLRFLQKNFPDSPALRGFDAALAVGRLRREATFIIKNGYWSQGYDQSRRDFTKGVAIGATALALAACGALPATEVSPNTPFPTNPNTAPATQKTVTPTPPPTEVRFEQQGQGTYGPPLPEEAVKFTAAGGESIRSILVRSIPDGDTVLTAYEEALLTWAEKQGHPRSSVQVEFLYNGGTGDNFRWQFYLRNTTTGNVLWTTDGSGAFQTYPVALSIDSVKGLYVADTYTLQEVPNTAGADVRFTKDNFVKILAGEPVTMNDTLYYSQWFNTLTGQFEAIPGVGVESTSPEQQAMAEHIKANIEAFMALDIETLREYMDKYAWKIRGVNTIGNRRPPSLDTSSDTENPPVRGDAFAFLDILPNLGIISGQTKGMRADGTISRDPWLQGIYLGSYKYTVNNIDEWFIVLGHVVGDKKTVSVGHVGPGPIGAAMAFFGASEEERVFAPNAIQLETYPMTDVFQKLQGREGTVVTIQFPVGLADPLGWEMTHDKVPENLRPFWFPTEDPRYLSWRAEFAKKHKLKPEDVFMSYFIAERGETFYQYFRQLYLAEAIRLGWTVDRSGISLPDVLANSTPADMTVILSPEALFTLRPTSLFDAAYFPYFGTLLIQRDDPPIPTIGTK